MRTQTATSSNGKTVIHSPTPWGQCLGLLLVAAGVLGWALHLRYSFDATAFDGTNGSFTAADGVEVDLDAWRARMEHQEDVEQSRIFIFGAFSMVVAALLVHVNNPSRTTVFNHKDRSMAVTRSVFGGLDSTTTECDFSQVRHVRTAGRRPAAIVEVETATTTIAVTNPTSRNDAEEVVATIIDTLALTTSRSI